jgi:hypothetical protein
MLRQHRFSLAIAGLISTVAFIGNADARSDCRFSVRGRNMILEGDCTTDATVLVPDGFTLNGGGFTITAVDPPGGHFQGAVVRNAGNEASVEHLRITTSNLIDVCDAGEDRLRGISLVGASGRIEGNTIFGLNEGGARSGCQEGIGIQAENSGPEDTEISIHDNRIQGYQKGGIQVSGAIRATVRENVLTGLGPVDFIAQNGIEIASGAAAIIGDNLIRANSYTGTQDVVSTGILVTGGPLEPTCTASTCPLTSKVSIFRNVLLENDVGVFLENVADGMGNPAETRTEISVIENVISKATLTNGTGTQIGIFDIGNRDRIVDNTISGPGYDPATDPAAFIDRIVAEAPSAIDPIVQRNRILP